MRRRSTCWGNIVWHSLFLWLPCVLSLSLQAPCADLKPRASHLIFCSAFCHSVIIYLHLDAPSWLHPLTCDAQNAQMHTRTHRHTHKRTRVLHACTRTHTRRRPQRVPSGCQQQFESRVVTLWFVNWIMRCRGGTQQARGIPLVTLAGGRVVMQNVSSQKRPQFGQKASGGCGGPIPLYDAPLYFKNHLAAVCPHVFTPDNLD